MTRCKSLICASALLALLHAMPGAVLAQPDSIEGCKAITEREARYSCYDAVEARENVAAPAVLSAPPVSATMAPVPPASPAAAPSTAAAVTATPTQALDDFGKSTARLEADAAGGVTLVDRVAGLKEVQFKQWQITLESGQVWRQQLSQGFNLKEGYEVRITPINGGPNHRLSSPQIAGSIQVRRLR